MYENNICIKRRILGFTMPELLITILLTGILFLLGLMLSSNMGQSQKLRDYSIAVALSQQAIEILRSAPFELLDDADAKNNSVEYDLNNDSGELDSIKPEFDSGGAKYKRTVVVTDIQTRQEPRRSVGLKYIKVTVEWESEGAKATTFVMETTVADMN